LDFNILPSSSTTRHKGECPMFYLYILRSKINSRQNYVNSTADLKKRLAEHNAGKSIHTNKFRPWALTVYVALLDREKAEKLERYLKTGSGRAFALRHLIE